VLILAGCGGSRVRSVGILSDPPFGLLLHGQKMQAPTRLPVIVEDIDLAARLRSNERSRTRRIPGMAARQIRQRCTPDSNSDRSCLASEFRLSWRPRAYHDDVSPPQRRARWLERRINRKIRADELPIKPLLTR
jgi:hypothetical protein